GPDSAHYGEIPAQLWLVAAATLDHSGSNGGGNVFELATHGLGWIARNFQIVCQRVCSAERNYPQCRLGVANHSLQHVMNCAIAAAGDDSVNPCIDRVLRLAARQRRTATLRDFYLHIRATQFCGSSFNLPQAMVATETRSRVVNE